MIARCGRFVTRRRGIGRSPRPALIVILSIPVFSVQPDRATPARPPDTPTRPAHDLLAEGFGPGSNGRCW